MKCGCAETYSPQLLISADPFNHGLLLKFAGIRGLSRIGFLPLAGILKSKHHFAEG
jgi:hypothetical protein